jgi:hypothetical protein
VSQKKTKYREGKEVAREFEEAMRHLFQTPKQTIDRKQPKATSRKDEQDDKD